MDKIRFRQPIYRCGKFHHWHYWGFVMGRFVSPVHDPHSITIADAQRDSQQYIGLKDKNNKEIYKRDVLSFEWGSCCGFCKKTLMHKAEVKFGPMGATVESYRILDPQSGMKNFEIVGNIIENPKLLEGEVKDEL